MHEIVQALIIGVLTGGVFALMASGQTLVFGLMKVVNLAQGALVVLSAYLTYSMFDSFGLDPFVSVLITTPLLFALGVGIHLVFLRPLRREDAAELSLLVTFAVALGIQGLLAVSYSTTYRSVKTSYANDSLTIAGYHLSVVRLAAFGLSVVVLCGLYALLTFTRVGRAVRATVQNPQSAQLLGVDTRGMAALGFGLGAATAAVSGAVYGMIYPFNSGSHYDLIARLLAIVVLGGLGSIGGAIVAAVAIGVTSSIVTTVVTPMWSELAVFLVLLLVLVVRPTGLFGARTRGAI